jgi:hypothetical protein
MGKQAVELLEHRILASTWYPFEPFLDLTRALHEVLFGGSDEGAVEMGRQVARQTLEGVYAAFVSHHQVGRVLRSLGSVWQAHYNFGELTSTLEDSQAQVRVSGYTDAPRWHGQLISGWIAEALVLAGARGLEFDLKTGPWQESGAAIEIGLRWTNA